MSKKKINILKNFLKKYQKYIWSFIGLMFVSLIISGYLYYNYVIEGLPSFEEIENPQPKLASTVYGGNGEILGQFSVEFRTQTNIDSIPQVLINELISTEDRDFYNHWGVDIDRVFKAIIKTVFLGSWEGGSSITQQLAKNIFNLRVQRETIFDTITRKIREWLTAVQLEKTYTKSEILEMYLNNSYFGNGAYGVGTAAQQYYGKKVNDLSISESALLVALLKSGVNYNPYKRYESALSRRNLVMKNLVSSGLLEDAKYEELKLEPIVLSERRSHKGIRSRVAPYFVEYIFRQLVEMKDEYDYKINEDGISVYTTLDTLMQSYAVKAAHEHLDEFQKIFDANWKWSENKELLDTILDEEIKKRKEYISAPNKDEKLAAYKRLKENIAFVDSVQNIKTRIQVAFVVLENKTGAIKAMVGGRNSSEASGLNRTVQMRRQPGSSFKPIIYTCAIDNGLYPAYPILNQRFDLNGWAPNNFDLQTSGFVTLRDGLRRSLNLIAARLIVEQHVKTSQVLIMAKKLGVKSRISAFPSIALGTEEVTPLELTSVYSTIANKGIFNQPNSISRIEDKDGILLDSFAPVTREAISEETAYIMTNMLQSVMDVGGTGNSARWKYGFTEEAGGKTGTAQDFADCWFAGFTPHLAAAVWVGFDDHRIKFTGTYGQGAKAALPIWAKFMKSVYDTVDFQEAGFEPPASGDVVRVSYCKDALLEFGIPRLYSSDCFDEYDDIANINTIPSLRFNTEKDTLINVFKKYLYTDSLSHEAIEIIE